MRRKTPLQILVEILGGSPEGDSAELKARARSFARGRRAREVADYLIAAVEERLSRRKKAGGSLKHILWWLRDHAGEMYEVAARAVLRETLAGRWPLSNALPYLVHLPELGAYVHDLQAPVDWRALAKEALRPVQVGPWKVAVNTTPLNLTGPAMRLGYHVMVARSEAGAAVKAQRGLVVDATQLPGQGWAQPYPDLAVWRDDAGEPPDLDEILAALETAIQGAA